MTAARDTAQLSPLPTDPTLNYVWKPGTGWTTVSIGSALRMENIATTTVGQTSYTVPNGYTVGALLVFMNGVLLQPGDYTATTGTTIVLTIGATSITDVVTAGVVGTLRAQDDALLSYTVATLPAAASNARKQRWCSDMSGGAGPVYSNGTNWLRYSDNTVVTT